MSDIVLDGGEIFNSIVQHFCSIKLFTSLQGKITERKYIDGYWRFDAIKIYMHLLNVKG